MTVQKADLGLIDRWIEQHPSKPGFDEARLRDRKISVWALIGYLKMVDGGVKEVATDYDLPVEAVEAAVAYYELFREVIDNRLLANDLFSPGTKRAVISQVVPTTAP